MRYTLGASDFVETGAVDCALSAFSFQLAFFFFFSLAFLKLHAICAMVFEGSLMCGV